MPARIWHTLTAMSAAIAVCTSVAAGPAAAAPPEPDDGGRIVVTGNTPAWATPRAEVGQVSGSAVRHVQIALSLRDPQNAQRLAAALATPGNPQYGRFLTAQQFLERFAPTEDTVARVTAWLSEQGLTVTGVSANRHFIDAHASTATLEKAFGTRIATFRARIDGAIRTLAAPTSPITLPRSLRPAVTAVLGLDDSATLLTPQHTTAPAARPGAMAAAVQHCARWWGEQNNTDVPQKYPAGSQSNSLCGYTGPSMRAMYHLTGSNTGGGTTIGIVGAYNSPTLVSDVNRAASQLGVPALGAGQYTAVLPDGGFTDEKECDAADWAGEQTLDVQASHTMAPHAKIRYYAGKTCMGSGLYDAFNRAVADNVVDVISNSYGNADGERSLPSAVRDQFNSMALQAAIQGQSITVSTGDAGNNSGPVGRATASFPASSPWVIAVGGTSVGLGASNEPAVLAGWENSGNTQAGNTWAPQQDADGPFAAGAGGGPSRLYDAPDWQAGIVPPSVAQGHRAIPDIAADADSYTGMLVGQTVEGTFQIGSYGGTSLAAPLIAGLVVDAQHARAGSARGGLLTPALYRLRGSAAITDVVPQKAGVWTPSMHVFGGVTVPTAAGSYLIDFDARPQNLQSGTGWDPVTGLGTPAAGFIAALAK